MRELTHMAAAWTASKLAPALRTKPHEGQGLVEHGLILLFIPTVSVIALGGLGAKILVMYEFVATKIP